MKKVLNLIALFSTLLFLSDSLAATNSTIQAKFGRSSISFDGVKDYLELRDSRDWYFGTEDFTVDFWTYMKGYDDARIASFIGQGPDNNDWAIRYDKGLSSLTFVSDTGYGPVNLSRSWNASLNTWYHIAVVRTGENFHLFVNGVQLGGALSDSDSLPDLAETLNIGRAGGDGSYRYLNGYLDEIRISKGIARWTSDFTPPSEPYSSDEFTVLLVHSDTFDGDTLFLDSSSKNHLVSNGALRTVPIPPSMLLLGSGLLGLCVIRRRLA